MNNLADLIRSFDVSILFDIIHGIATTVAMYLSPALLVVAIYIRVMETQLDSIVTGGKFGAALRDIIVWTFVLGSYFALGNLVFDFFNPIYRWIDNFGSISATMTTFSDLVEKAKANNAATGLTIEGFATAVVGAPYVIISAFLYYATLVVVGFLEVFLKVANVLVFGVAFIWGLIAIPVSISTTFRILRGWGLLLAFALVWPMVQGLIMAMFSALFINAANTLTQTAAPEHGALLVANIMLLAAVAHLLLAAVLVASPFITNALVSNAPSAAGIVMPFVGAAIAAGAGVAAATSGGGKMFSSVQSKLGGTPGKASLTAPSARGSGPVPRPAPTPNRVAVASSSGVDVGGDGGGLAPPPPGVSKARQQRRGTIIRQQMKKRST